MLMRALPWLYEIPGWCAALVPACTDGGGCCVGGARHLRERMARAAPRGDQHEYAGEPGHGRGVCLLGIRHHWPAPGRQVYFDAVLLILGFLLLGKSAGSARQAARPWCARFALAAAPATARRIVDGVQTVVPLEEIRPGRQILVLPGERFPVDGRSLRAARRWTSRC
jgi:hypothetical protein